MAKYSKTIASKICDLLREDSFTISEICKVVGIAECTYYDWINKKPEFSENIKRAKDDFNVLIVAKASRSLVKLVEGYTVKEERTVTVFKGKKNDFGDDIGTVKEHTVIDKHIQPNVAATIFALVNRDSDNWKNRQSTELTGKDGKDLITGSIDVDEWIKTKSKK
jgi:hypothetical protein